MQVYELPTPAVSRAYITRAFIRGSVATGLLRAALMCGELAVVPLLRVVFTRLLSANRDTVLANLQQFPEQIRRHADAPRDEFGARVANELFGAGLMADLARRRAMDVLLAVLGHAATVGALVSADAAVRVAPQLGGWLVPSVAMRGAVCTALGEASYSSLLQLHEFAWLSVLVRVTSWIPALKRLPAPLMYLLSPRAPHDRVTHPEGKAGADEAAERATVWDLVLWTAAVETGVLCFRLVSQLQGPQEIAKDASRACLRTALTGVCTRYGPGCSAALGLDHVLRGALSTRYTWSFAPACVAF